MITYSYLKERILQLHAAGYEKEQGEPAYVKTYTKHFKGKDYNLSNRIEILEIITLVDFDTFLKYTEGRCFWQLLDFVEEAVKKETLYAFMKENDTTLIDQMATYMRKGGWK